MKVYDVNISHLVAESMKKILNLVSTYNEANDKVFRTFRIKHFFFSQDEYDLFNETISASENIVSDIDRAEYGDFQTNQKLAIAVTEFLKINKINPKLVVEPTCGKGNFLIAALSSFSNIEKIVGVEIYKPYTWETKFNLLNHFIINPNSKRPEIEIHHFSVFNFDFKTVTREFRNKDILILGNPPWVTNSKLSSLDSNNLPKKSNFKRHSGLDAITGKGNFDIGESITLMMFDAFQHTDGYFAFLLKNSVIKNVIFDQNQRKYAVSNFQKRTIDSKKEFDVSVEASLLFCQLNSKPEFTCREFDFYKPDEPILDFGWINNKFVSNIDGYIHAQNIDGICPFEWRQGIKHDLSLIMEFEKETGGFINGYNQVIALEEDLIYGVLKSSDLKQMVVNQPRKFTIITQKKVGQDTSYIRQKFPKTFTYLESNKPLFDSRKSSIYHNKPDFSIFGIGDYSFLPYKISISGFYKTVSFSLVLPYQGKPLMLDDTCYLLGFDNINFAAYTLLLLNSDNTKEFLKSITFTDAKRTYTKEVLMRIELLKLAEQISEIDLKQGIKTLTDNYQLSVTPDLWQDYMKLLKPKSVGQQIDLFAEILK